jgi:hypothetical protein
MVFMRFAAPPATADVALHQRVIFQFTPGQNEKPRKVIFYAKGRRARLEGDAWRKKPTIIQFDKGVIVRLNPAKKTFTQIDLKDLENAAKGVSKIVKGLDEILSGKKPGRRKGRYRLEPTDVREKVSGFASRMYTVRRNGKGKIRAKVWITKESEGGREIYALQREITGVAANLLPLMDPKLIDELERVGGTAVKILLLGKTGAFGPVRTEMIVEKIGREPLKDSLFEVPPGYRENADSPGSIASKRKPSSLEKRLKALQKLFQ